MSNFFTASGPGIGTQSRVMGQPQPKKAREVSLLEDIIEISQNDTNLA